MPALHFFSPSLSSGFCSSPPGGGSEEPSPREELEVGCDDNADTRSLQDLQAELERVRRLEALLKSDGAAVACGGDEPGERSIPALEGEVAPAGSVE